MKLMESKYNGNIVESLGKMAGEVDFFLINVRPVVRFLWTWAWHDMTSFDIIQEKLTDAQFVYFLEFSAGKMDFCSDTIELMMKLMESKYNRI